MSVPSVPPPAKLVASMIATGESVLREVIPPMEAAFGPVDFAGDLLEFSWTSYYAGEMGASLVRRFVSFERLVEQDRLPEIKLRTNEVERLFSREGKRTVNIDPGLVTLERLVLATGKNFTHRIYLGRGIFADLTLVFRKKSFHPLPWTFPDYADDVLLRLMNGIRERYKIQLRERTSGGPP